MKGLSDALKHGKLLLSSIVEIIRLCPGFSVKLNILGTFLPHHDCRLRDTSHKGQAMFDNEVMYT